MVINLLQTMIFLMPVIGILAGLSLSVSVTIFLLLLVIKFQKNLKFKTTSLVSIFLLWCFISCFWAPNILASIILFIYVAFLILFALSVSYSLEEKDKARLQEMIFKPLYIGIFVGILVFVAEYLSGGFFSLQFKSIVQGKDGPFALYWLDRGCSFVSVISWVVIGYLFQKKRYLIGIGLICAMFFLLMTSDSFASFVGFSLGIIGYVLMYFTKMRFGVLLRIAFASYIFIMPIVSFYQNPHFLSDEYSIPESSKHRLFIWNFVAKKTLDHPVVGHGFGSSRYVPGPDDVVEYKKGIFWSLLPLHPHNNSLQVLLETGLIGLFLFVFIVDKILKNIIIRCKDSVAGAVSISCFCNYFFIGMVSFGLWQIWWFNVGIFATIIVNIFFLGKVKEN